jgi:hypothetical protein
VQILGGTDKAQLAGHFIKNPQLSEGGIFHGGDLWLSKS